MPDCKIWEAIKIIISGILPEIASTLNPPASTSDINRLETEVGFPLPLSFKEYLSVFNGQTDVGINIPLVSANRFLPIGLILEDMSMQKELFGDDEPLDHIRENKIQPVLWDNLWVPFANFQASTRLILNLHAGKNGKNGQVILLFPGVDMEADKIVIASSFEDFGVELLRRLESGAYRLKDRQIEFEDFWIV
jgi:cell wall assembly regulator SMI1